MNDEKYLEVSSEIMKKLGMSGYKFRPVGWGVKPEKLNEYLRLMERENLISYDFYLGSIDYSSVKLIR